MYVHLQYGMVNLQTTHPWVAKVQQNHLKSSKIEVWVVQLPVFPVGFFIRSSASSGLER